MGELSELLSTVGGDLRSDGKRTTTPARGPSTKNAATLVSVAAVREQIVQRYAALGVPAQVGAFEPLVLRFRDEAPGPYVSRVAFPPTGMYGPNLLDGTTDQRTAGDYSLIVMTPPEQPFRVHCTWLGAPGHRRLAAPPTPG